MTGHHDRLVLWEFVRAPNEFTERDVDGSGKGPLGYFVRFSDVEDKDVLA